MRFEFKFTAGELAILRDWYQTLVQEGVGLSDNSHRLGRWIEEQFERDPRIEEN